MIKKIDHIGIAVSSIENSLPFYTNILNLQLEGIEEVESENVKIAFIKIGESKLELLEPLSPESPIAKFIEKRGEGIHHIALGVSSIEARIQDMKENGIRMLSDESKLGAGGAKIAFMHPKSTGSVLYELCEKPSKGEMNK
ncbi:methylmalonyl-CoA epimerase [Fredinandcohnia onubensis]|uniref:methylmalonyl-CoA epimerase n=1 Tax=Fredinandcohnia onubensis TaxID=1571209 RepID=UPI000C0BC9D5|nr:methylmalonyl-CoA epimerase [Fredinandcohnia onubensis]